MVTFWPLVSALKDDDLLESNGDADEQPLQLEPTTHKSDDLHKDDGRISRSAPRTPHERARTPCRGQAQSSAPCIHASASWPVRGQAGAAATHGEPMPTMPR
jgi:hypothetical protein